MFLTEAGGIVEREVVHHSGTKKTPPEEEVLGSLLHWSTALLTGLIGDTGGEERALGYITGHLQDKYEYQMVNSCYLDDFMFHDRVQPLDERLHCGVLSQQLLQLLKDGDRVV